MSTVDKKLSHGSETSVLQGYLKAVILYQRHHVACLKVNVTVPAVSAQLLTQALQAAGGQKAGTCGEFAMCSVMLSSQVQFPTPTKTKLAFCQKKRMVHPKRSTCCNKSTMCACVFSLSWDNYPLQRHLTGACYNFSSLNCMNPVSVPFRFFHCGVRMGVSSRFSVCLCVIAGANLYFSQRWSQLERERGFNDRVYYFPNAGHMWGCKQPRWQLLLSTVPVSQPVSHPHPPSPRLWSPSHPHSAATQASHRQ